MAAIVDTVLEPGDRFEITITPATRATGRVSVPETLLAVDAAFGMVGDEKGTPLRARFDDDGKHLDLGDWARSLPDQCVAAWLEYRAPGRFGIVAEPAPVLQPPLVPTEQNIPVSLAPESWELVHADRSASLPEWDLALRAARLASHAGFDRLICLPMVRDMEILEHQVRTAKTVLRRFRGRALLCDEVGLGKTIEAGLVLDELCTRGLVRSALVLVPPSLIEQWQGEMRRKFGLDFISHDDPAFRERGSEAWGHFDRIIASIHTAKREPHRSAIVGRKWDIIIVDEAHHLRNRNTQTWRFASELEKQYILLLTATPVQNNLEELFNLVTLLEPGLLSTARKFQKQFVDRKDKLTPRNVDELHALLSEVMVRNRRSTVGLQFTRRWARTDRVALTAPERALYDDAAAFVREHLRTAKGTGTLSRRASGLPSSYRTGQRTSRNRLSGLDSGT
jgi:SNF2 family DNA or RNA helicase